MLDPRTNEGDAMDERPEWTPEELEALEALRSVGDAEDDPLLASTAEALQSNPELKQRYERLRRWDARVAQVIQDVPAPPGLAEQILQRLEAARTASPTDCSSGRGPVRRKRLAWAAAASLIAAAAVLAVVVLMDRLPRIEPGTLESIARERFLADRGGDLQGHFVSDQAPPKELPYSSDLVADRSIRWRHAPDFRGAEAVAYDIPLGGGRRATLYAVQCRSPDLPVRPPSALGPQTRNLAIAAWRTPDGDVTYVVVVEGGEPFYRELLKSASRQLT